MKQNMKTSKQIFTVIFFTLPVFCLFAQPRHFAEVFPACTAEQRNAAFSTEGYLYYGDKSGNLTLMPKTGETLGISKSSLGKSLGFFVEALRIIPRKNIGLVNIFNALEKIRDLKGRTYYSATSKKNLPLFTDAVRVEGPGKINAFLPDPPPAGSVPAIKNMHARLTDVRFGNCYFEITLQSDQRGILYKINNFKALTYGPIPVVKERVMTVLLYIEPVEEGLALYCLAGAEVSDFIAKHVDIPTALNKRMEIFIQWLLDGIK